MRGYRDSISLTTVALSPRTVSILIALALSGAFIAAGYFLSGPFATQMVGAASNEALLKEYAQKDTDGDGLLDWREVVYGTDPENAHSVDAAMTDAEAVAAGKVTPRFASETVEAPLITDEDFEVDNAAPGSVTDEFAKVFFQTYMESAEGGTGASATNDQLVKEFMTELNAYVSQKIRSTYSATSVRTSDTVTVQAYAAAIEQVLKAHPVPSDPLEFYVESYIVNENQASQEGVVLFADAYTDIASDLQGVIAPPAFASSHASLVRAFTELGKTTTFVAEYESDPLGTSLALGAYPTILTELSASFTTLANAIQREGTPAVGAPGALILDIVRTTGGL